MNRTKHAIVCSRSVVRCNACVNFSYAGVIMQPSPSRCRKQNSWLPESWLPYKRMPVICNMIYQLATNCLSPHLPYVQSSPKRAVTTNYYRLIRSATHATHVIPAANVQETARLRALPNPEAEMQPPERDGVRALSSVCAGSGRVHHRSAENSRASCWASKQCQSRQPQPRPRPRPELGGVRIARCSIRSKCFVNRSV